MNTLAVVVCLFSLNDNVEEREIVLFPVCERERWGFMNKLGDVVVPLSFDYAFPFSDGLARVIVEGEEEEPKMGFVDKDGRFVIGPGPPVGVTTSRYSDDGCSYYDFHEGYAGFLVGGFGAKGGYIDRTGRVVIAMKYQQISDFQEGLACVALFGDTANPYGSPSTGFINRNDEFVIPPTNDFIASGFAEGLCEFMVRDSRGTLKGGFINRRGEKVVPAIYDGTQEFSDGLARVRVMRGARATFGYIALDGTQRIPIEFDFASSFSGGRACVIKDNMAMLINTKGEILAPLDHAVSYVGEFSEGLADVVMQKAGSTGIGFIDKKGAFAISPDFDQVDPFSGGLARAARGKETGYINRDGEFVWKTDAWEEW